MRADRLLSILLQLETGRAKTARELAGQLEVCERTIYRDMDALTTAGVPVVATRGQQGGWRLLEPYKTELTGLNSNEIRALFASPPAKLLAELGLKPAAETARAKLLAALPQSRRRDAEYARERMLVDPSSWRGADDAVPHLPALYAAVWEDRRIRFLYNRELGSAHEREGDPLGLVAKGASWYLVASVDSSIRTYRVSRIGCVDLLDEPAHRPEGFRLAEYWAESGKAFQDKLPKYFITVKVPEKSMGWVRWSVRGNRIEELGDQILRIRFDARGEALRFVLGCGAGAELIEPRELRAEAREEALRTAALYVERGDSVD